jgi:hypothetical protein
MEEMSNDSFDSAQRDDAIDGVGLTIGAMQAVARRQLVGSVVVAILVATVAGVVALRSTDLAAPSFATAHNIRGVQQPTFVTPPEHLIATTKRAVEVP